MRIAICEDMVQDVAHLRGLLSRYLEENSLFASIDCFQSGEEFLAAFVPGKYQIVFMDIFMRKDGMSGMEAAARVREADRDVAVILVTSSEAFALAGYRVAVYYILKPIDRAELARAMERCRAQILSFAKTIEVTENRRPVQIRLREIASVESQRRTCLFRLTYGEVRANLPIHSLLGPLGGFPFVQCHRSFIVNLIHTAELTGRAFIMTSGHKVPVSKAYQADALRAFRRFAEARITGDPL